MAKVFYVHWNEAELKERIKPLQAAGNEVLAHWNTETGAKVKEPYPEAFVVSLDRLPSHGKAFAGWVVESKKRQAIPLIFEGGPAEKVATIKQKFPQALYCQTGAAADVVHKLQSGKLKYKGSAETTTKGAGKTSVGNDTFEQLVTRYNPEVQAIARRLREIIYEVLPKADEKVWATGWSVARYADGAELVAIGPLKNYCNLFFAQGAHLPNSDGLLEGTGKGIRHIKVRSLDTIPVGAIKKLMREAKKYAKANPERRWKA